jgi:arsenate reductase (thioredoxin)
MTSQGLSPAPPIRVLFVCTGNSARSQIAEAILGRLGGADFTVFSAGTHPGDVNPLTVRALAEIGIDWSGARSKSVTEFLDESFDYVITVCDQAREACPVFPGEHEAIHWGFDDPAAAQGTDEQRMAVFRRVMGEITLHIKPFVEVARRAHGRDQGIPAQAPR